MSPPWDRIEKKIFLRAPQDRVWRALTDAAEFGDWFGMDLDGQFVPGAQMTGRIKPTLVDPPVAEAQKNHAGLMVSFVVEHVEPMGLFSYRWHPFAIDPNLDYASEPMTLVTFTLESAEGGTLLRVAESGFDSLPLERRMDAYEANEEGWSLQMQLIEKYLSLPQL